MDFKFKPKLSKNLILSEISEEQIMEFYLNVPVKKGLFRSPLRKDRHPTCSFYKSTSGALIFKDFATGQNLNVFGVVQALYNCDYKECLEIIANDFHIHTYEKKEMHFKKVNYNPNLILKKSFTEMRVEIQDFTKEELKWWNQFGINIKILNKYNVYSCKNVFLNGKLIAQSKKNYFIFGYYGGKIIVDGVKKELWKCYFPMRTEYRFLGNYTKEKIQGFEVLPKWGKLLVISKSNKDVMCLHSMKIYSCAPNSENLFIPDDILESLKKRFKNIVVLYDNDRAGMYNMAKIRREHPEFVYTMIPKKYGSKDISDFYKDYGRVKTMKLIKTFVLWLRKQNGIQK